MLESAKINNAVKESGSANFWLREVIKSGAKGLGNVFSMVPEVEDHVGGNESAVNPIEQLVYRTCIQR